MIPLNVPYVAKKAPDYIEAVLMSEHCSGNGPFTKKCQEILEKNTGAYKALLTNSCTSALELAALVIGIKSGDEVIMPSYTFVSTANAFLLRGALPVFVDVDPQTLNISSAAIKTAITAKTKAICVVHYAGVSCDMESILAIADEHGLVVVEDAAQGIMAKYNGNPLGTIGHLGCISFHETKNVHCGQGGALLLKDSKFCEKAEIIWEKGTNRQKFIHGLVDKYSWCDVGSSFLTSEISAALLLAQLEDLNTVTNARLKIWQKYHQAFKKHEEKGNLTRPFVPNGCVHNAHIYYLILRTQKIRDRLLDYLKKRSINAAFHYIPLHNTKFGRQNSRCKGSLKNTIKISQQILRLPIYPSLKETEQLMVIEAVGDFFSKETE